MSFLIQRYNKSLLRPRWDWRSADRRDTPNDSLLRLGEIIRNDGYHSWCKSYRIVDENSGQTVHVA